MRNLIKLLILISFLTLSHKCYSQADTKICYNIGGYWSKWTNSIYTAYGNFDNFVLYIDGTNVGRNSHPSEFVLRVVISNYKEPDKKTIKQHKKDNTWYVYNGIVEYWVCDEYPTIQAVLKSARSGAYPFISNPDSYIYYNAEWGRRVKRTANATIKIGPYDKSPRVYNLFFDNVGVGIEFR